MRPYVLQDKVFSGCFAPSSGLDHCFKAPRERRCSLGASANASSRSGVSIGSISVLQAQRSLVVSCSQRFLRLLVVPFPGWHRSCSCNAPPLTHEEIQPLRAVRLWTEWGGQSDEDLCCASATGVAIRPVMGCEHFFATLNGFHTLSGTWPTTDKSALALRESRRHGSGASSGSSPLTRRHCREIQELSQISEFWFR